MLENLDEVYDWAQDPLGNQAGVGYTVNSLSLIYRSDLIEAEVTSWADLLRDDVAGFVSIPEMSTTFGPATLIMIDRALAMQALEEGEELDEINYDADMAWEALPQLADNLVTTYIRSSALTTLVQEEEVWVAPYASFAIGNLINTGHDLKRGHSRRRRCRPDEYDQPYGRHRSGGTGACVYRLVHFARCPASGSA